MTPDIPEAAQAVRTLVVEDDPEIAELYASFLASEGFAVERCESALGLQALLRRWRPDVILLDLGLPFRSGATLLLDLKADPQTAEIPVVIVSAAPEALAPDRAALAAAVLPKPVALKRLLATVRGARRNAPDGPAALAG
jgi:two-component system KDP operon response regulator KdpE